MSVSEVSLPLKHVRTPQGDGRNSQVSALGKKKEGVLLYLQAIEPRFELGFAFTLPV